MRLVLAFLAACSPPVIYRPVFVRQACEQRAARPAIACAYGELGYDGCRWGCTLEPVEMGPASITLDLGADVEMLMQTNLCATPTYCEAK
jgi:hypothetical protein